MTCGRLGPVSDTVTVPDGMRITIWHSLTEFTTTPVRAILHVPTTVTASYDGNAPGWVPETPPRRLIGFSFSFLGEIAGRAMAEVDEIAAMIAAHLAAMDEDWPGQEAHVRLYPVVDISLMWEVTPDLQPDGPRPDVTLSLLSQIMPGITGTAVSPPR
jgi:hypothetical protein